ncbi:hypothetical protein LCGC14_1302150 [marine sediment metagenome]|uniref:Uncharacterized protein n=1 Tax=marine sediment metagenome TaxID=412755 RepID=A0A0F9KPM8_9ZZZZ
MTTTLLSTTSQTSRVDETTERLVRAHLKGMDSLLDLLWVPTAVQTPGGLDGRYAITCTWAQVDKRWKMYHDGEIGEPFDVLGWITEAAAQGDFHVPSSLPVDPASILDKVVEFLGKCDNTRDGGWRGRMEDSMKANQLQREAVRKVSTDEMFEHLEYNRQRIAGGSLVHLGAGKRKNIIPRKE